MTDNSLKRVLIILTILLISFSCSSQKETNIIPALSLTGNGSFESNGGNCTINVSSSDKWEFLLDKDSQEWFEEKSKGNSYVVFKVLPNENEQLRTAIVIVKLSNFDRSETFNIVQVGKKKEYVYDNPIDHGYTLQSSMQGDLSLVGKDNLEIHSHMRKSGWDYSEHPNSSDKDHNDGIHCMNIYDETLKQNVFQFFAHVNPFLDGDRGKLEDRQRNEMKSQTSTTWYKMNGNWDEWQWLEWKFKIPKGYRPSTSFCHIHQLKAQEGDNNGSPLITITLRGNNDGKNRRFQVIHTGDVGASSNKGTIVDNIPLEEFEDEWVQVQEEVHYTHNGSFRIKIIRIRDNKVLVDYKVNNIDMWRKDATNIRNKFGIYRSYGKKLTDSSDRPNNGIKDESIYLADFYVYEKNTNSNPQPHD